jgi:NACalpha-BTF3-like transcription factor
MHHNYMKGEVYNMKIIKTVNTKMTEEHEAVQTELTLDFTGLTPDDIMEIAAQAAVIKWQGNARRGKVIPVKAEYKVQRAGSRVQIDPVTAILRKHNGDVNAAIAELQSLSK